MRRHLTVLLSLICMAFTVNAAKADKRVAFVVGNGAYKNVTALPNPPMDAKAIASLLRNMGFDVVEGSNLSREPMSQKLLDFSKRTQGADVALFFYAGHGIAVDGVNYLLPVDADIKSVADVKLGAAINIDDALDQTMQGAKVKLVFLDACRDNPFAVKIKQAAEKASRSVSVPQGLAEMKSAEGTLISFATGPGQTALDGPEGTHSPFTNALLAHLPEKGIEIQQVMTEVRAEVHEQTNNGQLPWGNTNLIGTVYLNGSPAPAAPAAPAQASNGVAPAAAAAAPAVASATPGSDVEVEFWRSVRDSNKSEELNAYLTKYPEGQFAPLARARIAALDNGPSTTTRNLSSGVDPAVFTDDSNQVTEDQIGLDKSQRRDVQRRLTGLGFDTKATGIFNDDTRIVIKRWQTARGYPATGYLNKLQHKALLSEIVSASSGNDDSDKPSSRGSDDESSHRVVRRSSGGGGGRGGGGGGGNPGAFMGGMIGGMMGGMLRH
jgi:uncharacterized caspase-like protein